MLRLYPLVFHSAIHFPSHYGLTACERRQQWKRKGMKLMVSMLFRAKAVAFAGAGRINRRICRQRKKRCVHVEFLFLYYFWRNVFRPVRVACLGHLDACECWLIHIFHLLSFRRVGVCWRCCFCCVMPTMWLLAALVVAFLVERTHPPSHPNILFAVAFMSPLSGVLRVLSSYLMPFYRQ